MATDDHYAKKILSQSLPQFKFIQKNTPQCFSGKSLHYSSTDKEKLVINCLLDIYMLLHAKIFIPSMNSGLSKWIVSMVKDKRNLFDVDTHIFKIVK